MPALSPQPKTLDTYTPNGTGKYQITFEYELQTDVYVGLYDDTTKSYKQTPQDDATNPWGFENETSIEFTNGDPGVDLMIYRSTDANNMVSEFYTGSAIRAQDLNYNFEQLLFCIQELTDAQSEFETRYQDIQGPEGPPGPQGPAGPTGPQGPKGDDGIKLEDGIYDPAAPPVCDTAGNALIDANGDIWVCDGEGTWVNSGPVQGPEGPLGPVGPQGSVGPRGETGPQGPAGPQGEKGDPGTDGSDGSDGTDGGPGPKGSGWTGGSYDPTTGKVSFDSDDGLEFETEDLRSVAFNYTGNVATQGDLPASGNDENDFKIVEDTGIGYVWTGGSWVEVGPIRGPKGDDGDPGPAATVDVGTTSTSAPGTSAAVSNSGTTSAAIFNFQIPEGEKGDAFKYEDFTDAQLAALKGDKGDKGTISIQATNTLNPGESATVTDSSSDPSNAVLTFGIPKGEKGDDGTSLKLLGTKPTVDDLPASGNEQGDMWIVDADGDAYAWDGTAWNNVGDITGPQGEKGDGYTAGSYDSATGKVTLTGDPSTLTVVTDDLRGEDGKGWKADGTGYNSSTGVVTFASNDGLGFATGDLRGDKGDRGGGVNNTISNTAPTEELADFWTDTSQDAAAPTLKTWNGTDWIPVGGGSSSLQAPQISAIALTEDSPGGDRFTDQTFSVDFTMGNDGNPVSQKGVKGEVTANFATYYETDTIASVNVTSQDDPYTQPWLAEFKVWQHIQGGRYKNQSDPYLNNIKFDLQPVINHPIYGTGWFMFSFSIYYGEGTSALDWNIDFVEDLTNPSLTTNIMNSPKVSGAGHSISNVQLMDDYVYLGYRSGNQQGFIWNSLTNEFDFLGSHGYNQMYYSGNAGNGVFGYLSTQGGWRDTVDYDSYVYVPRLIMNTFESNSYFVDNGEQSYTREQRYQYLHYDANTGNRLFESVSERYHLIEDLKHDQWILLYQDAYYNSSTPSRYKALYFDVNKDKIGGDSRTFNPSTGQWADEVTGDERLIYRERQDPSPIADGGYDPAAQSSNPFMYSQVFTFGKGTPNEQIYIIANNTGDLNSREIWKQTGKTTWAKCGTLTLPNPPSSSGVVYPKEYGYALTRDESDGFLYLTSNTPVDAQQSSVEAAKDMYLFRSINEGATWQVYGPSYNWRGNDSQYFEEGYFLPGVMRRGFGKEIVLSQCYGATSNSATRWRYSNSAWRYLNKSDITLTSTTGLEYVTEGDSVYKASDPNNSDYWGRIYNYSRPNGTLSIDSTAPYAVGDVIGTYNIKNNESSSRFLTISSTGLVTGTTTVDPGYTQLGPGLSQNITFDSTFDTGNPPDDELPVGTTLKVHGSATNSQATDTYGPSNTVTPSS